MGATSLSVKMTNLIRRAVGTDDILRRMKILEGKVDSEPFAAHSPEAQNERRQRQKAEKARRRYVECYGEDVCLSKPFYNLGAGSWRHPCWQNVDIVHERYAENQPDIVYDMFSGEDLPIATGTAKLFYSSHVIEHVDDEHNRIVFSNIYRCLEKGGAVRFVFPDIEKAYDAYARGDKAFFVSDRRGGEDARKRRASKSMGNLLIDFFASRAQVGSPSKEIEKIPDVEFEQLIRDRGLQYACDEVASRIPIHVQKQGPNAHMNWWSHDKLKQFLEEAGFTTVYQSQYASSRFYPFRDRDYFDRTVPHISGYVEAVK